MLNGKGLAQRANKNLYKVRLRFEFTAAITKGLNFVSIGKPLERMEDITKRHSRLSYYDLNCG